MTKKQPRHLLRTMSALTVSVAGKTSAAPGAGSRHRQHAPHHYCTLVLAILALLIQSCECSIVSAAGPTSVVGPIPETLRENLGLAAFYQKHIAVAGFPIVGSANVSDNALREAAWIV